MYNEFDPKGVSMTTPSKDTLTTEQKLKLLRTDELIA